MSPTDGLRAASFEAYSPEKWASNVFTRERLEVKQRLLSLARDLEQTFTKAELKLQRYASDEYPSLRNGKKVDAQWVFFWRSEEERLVLERTVDFDKTLAATIADPTPMARHAFLCLRLDQVGLEMSFRLHRNAWVDQHNLMNKLGDEANLSELIALLKKQPQHFMVDVDNEEFISAEDCSDSSIVALVNRHSNSDRSDGFLRLGVRLSKEEALELSSGLLQHLEPMLVTLAEIYRFAAWAETNNFVSTDEEFLERQAQRGARRQEQEATEAQRRADQELRKREQGAARQELEEVFRREAAARAAAPKRPKPRPHDDKPPQKKVEGNRAAPKEKPKAPAVKPRPPQKPQPVQTGHQARVSKGPFSGQVGLVQEVDSRGSARIMIGLLATRIPVEDLVGLGPLEED